MTAVIISRCLVVYSQTIVQDKSRNSHNNKSFLPAVEPAFNLRPAANWLAECVNFPDTGTVVCGKEVSFAIKTIFVRG